MSIDDRPRRSSEDEHSATTSTPMTHSYGQRREEKREMGDDQEDERGMGKDQLDPMEMEEKVEDLLMGQIHLSFVFRMFFDSAMEERGGDRDGEGSRERDLNE